MRRAVFVFLSGILTTGTGTLAQAQTPAPPARPVLPVPDLPVPPPPPAKAPRPAPPPAAAPAPAVQPAPAPAPPILATELAPERRAFIKPKVPVALFTQEKTALLDVECDRIAVFLARYAAEKYTDAILRDERDALSRGRLLLTISLHLAPLNSSAVHCIDRWADGKAPSLPPPGEDVRTFAGFMLSAAQRQGGEAGTARDVLARVLIHLAADLDPKNEDAVYASEMQDRAGKEPPLRELLEGTVSVK